jgi:hypothetical protein
MSAHTDIQNQLATLRASCIKEKIEKDLDQLSLLLYIWIFTYYKSYFNTIPMESVSDDNGWCRSNSIEQTIYDKKLTDCQFMPMQHNLILKIMAENDIIVTPQFSDCFFCSNHNTVHICSNNANISKNIFNKKPDKDGCIFVKKELTIRTSQNSKKTMYTYLNGSKVSIVFGTCKCMATRTNNQSDYEYHCKISKRKLSPDMAQMWIAYKNDFMSDETKPKELKQKTPKKKQPVLPAKTISQENILFGKLFKELEEADNPNEYIIQLLQKISDAQSKKDMNKNCLDKTLGADAHLIMLSKLLNPQKKKALDYSSCKLTILNILNTFFYSKTRKNYNQTIKSDKTALATKSIKLHIEKKIKEESKVPCIIELYRLLKSITTTSSETDNVPQSPKDIINIVNIIYKKWIIILLSPYAMKTQGNPDLSSVTISLLYHMKKGGRDLGSYKIINENRFVVNYLPPVNNLQLFGFKKRQLTNGNEIVLKAYSSMITFE